MTELETFLYTCLKNIGTLLESDKVDPTMARILANKLVNDGLNAFAKKQQETIKAPTGPGGIHHGE